MELVVEISLLECRVQGMLKHAEDHIPSFGFLRVDGNVTEVVTQTLRVLLVMVKPFFP